MALPTDPKARKAAPIFSGVLKYFPDALAAVAELSRIGNEQHNPGKPLHWDRSKSTDEGDALSRHLVEAGTIDTDGVRHSTKVAWRALALLQKELEAAAQTSAPEIGTEAGFYKAALAELQKDAAAERPRPRPLAVGDHVRHLPSKVEGGVVGATPDNETLRVAFNTPEGIKHGYYYRANLVRINPLAVGDHVRITKLGPYCGATGKAVSVFGHAADVLLDDGELHDGSGVYAMHYLERL